MKFLLPFILLLTSLYSEVHKTTQELIDDANSELKNTNIDAGLMLIVKAYKQDPQFVEDSPVSKLITMSVTLSTAKEYAKENDDPHAWKGVGDIYFDLGLYPEAQKAYQKSLAINPLLTGTRINSALSYVGINEIYRAVDELKIAIKNDPNSYKAHYFLAHILKDNLADPKTAKVYFEQAQYLNKCSKDKSHCKMEKP